jgi:hydroxyacylglutathione hydrolase
MIDEANGVELRRVVVGYLDTNCWIVRPLAGREALIVDPGDEPDRIVAAAAGLDVVGIVITHAHADHVLALARLAADLDVPIIGHPAEAEVWTAELDYLSEHGHLDAGTATADLVASGNLPRPDPALPLWDGHLEQRSQLSLGPLTIDLLHTPGHTPGSLCLRLPGHLLSGDTLFPGGPGLTGAQWPLSSFPDIMTSVRRLLTDLPPDTVVHPGHGPDTTVATEHPHLEEWQTRGW